MVLPLARAAAVSTRLRVPVRGVADRAVVRVHAVDEAALLLVRVRVRVRVRVGLGSGLGSG